MGAFSTVSTVSHRYYEKRAKSEIRQNIRDMCRVLEIEPPSDEAMTNETASQLASRAMKLHDLFPEGT